MGMHQQRRHEAPSSTCIHTHRKALPWEPTNQQKQQGVGKGLEVVPAAGSAAQVCVHAGIADRSPVMIV